MNILNEFAKNSLGYNLKISLNSLKRTYKEARKA